MVDGVRRTERGGEKRTTSLAQRTFMANHLVIQQTTFMHIFLQVILIAIFFAPTCDARNSSCSLCASNFCYQCYNALPAERANVDKLTVICNGTNQLFYRREERFYSIIRTFTTVNCTMRTLYLDYYTLWNYLDSLSITHANLTHLSPTIINRSLSLSLPILYSVKTLNLSFNAIRIINKNFSFYFPSLEKLDLSHNRLILIKKKTFINLIYLKQLYLNNNYLKQILPNVFPRQSLYFINLNKNHWYCSCTNVLTLSISQPIPICYAPKEFQHQNASDMARQCFLHTKANLLVTTNMNRAQNLTCVLSPVMYGWKSKINRNISSMSIWHIEQRRSIPLTSLASATNQSNEHLVCFNFSAPHPEAIHTVITPASLASLSRSEPKVVALRSLLAPAISNTTVPMVTSAEKLSPLSLWLLNTSKNILPTSLRTSDRQILFVWLILLSIALFAFLSLVYFIHRHKTNDKYYFTRSYSFTRFDTGPPSPLHQHHTLFRANFTCKNHKCLCQYRRRAHSTLHLPESRSPSLLGGQIYSTRPLLIEPSELRYAKIKRISSAKEMTNDYSPGEFRTIIKLKSLPS